MDSEHVIDYNTASRSYGRHTVHMNRRWTIALLWLIGVAITLPTALWAKEEQMVTMNDRVRLSTDAYTPGQSHTTTLSSDAVLDLVWITPGTFTMGSPRSGSSSQEWERPQTGVIISKGFWLGKTLVTQGQYQAVMGKNPSYFTNVGLDAPVEQVSWSDAMEFCRKVTEQECAAGHLPQGFAFTLPTEAQWEYACRAGTTGPRYAENIDSIAWYNGNSGDSTHPVGQKEPNAFGLYDMLGNVWEWCSDRWADRLSGGIVTDPVGPDSGSYRVSRGGDWGVGAGYCRSASRRRSSPSNRHGALGFRVALSSVGLRP